MNVADAWQTYGAIPAARDQVHDDGFARLAIRHTRFVFQVAWAVLRNAHDAEDVVQETFLKLHRTGAWRRMTDEKAFLARTAWRLSVDRLRADRRGYPAAVAEPVLTPEEIAIAEDRDAAIHRLIDALPEDLRQPLALSAIDEMTSGEIANAMGISEGTVRTRIMRARQLLKLKISAAALRESRP